jgi:hypothetical protein
MKRSISITISIIIGIMDILCELVMLKCHAPFPVISVGKIFPYKT